MCGCNKNMDGYCGTCHNEYDGFKIFGREYDLNVTKLDKKDKSDSSETSTDEKKSKKKIDIEKLASQAEQGGSLIDSLLSGFKKKPSYTPPPMAETAAPVEEKSNMAMYIGIALAVIVVVFLIWKPTRK